MSEANVEIAKRAIDAFNRLDVDDFAELTTPDSELFRAFGALEGGSYRGRQGIEAWFRDLRDAWEETRIVADERRDLGESVLLLGRLQGRGRGSGVRVDAPIGGVLDLRDGKIARLRSYLDHGEALRAAGLSE
jgi:ketosteroid isomerase-like protein